MIRIQIPLVAFSFFVAAAMAAGQPSPASAAEGVQLAQRGAAELYPGDEGEYAKTGAKKCLKCHNERSEVLPVLSILKTRHAVRADGRTPFGETNQDCETCHGASPEHTISRARLKPGEVRPPTKIGFGPPLPGTRRHVTRNGPYPSAQVQNGVCLSCHESGLRLHWKGGPHEAKGLRCATCHQIHVLRDAVAEKKTQPFVCFNCHRDRRADIYKPSSHPILEGQVTCSDCHNPHGSRGPSQLVRNTLNETCYTCHTEKRGPFLWEHPPARENCGNCHRPHGSVYPRLLVARQPWLCQQCHLATFHPSTNYSGDDVPPLGAAQQLLANSCENCHPKVHGSNHPSGPRFTR